MSRLRVDELETLDGTHLVNVASIASSLVVESLEGDLKSNTNISIGDSVRTLGYNYAGDGGDNSYIIVAGGTGTPDGGTYIDLPASGLQAKGLFRNNVANAKQFGATGDGVTDDTDALTSWGNSGMKSLYIPHGVYLIDSVFPADPDVIPCVTVTGDDLRVTCDGVITTGSENYKGFVFETNNSVIQLNIDGADLLNQGLQVDGDDNDIQGCNIHNLRATSYSAIGIRVNYVEGGVRVFNNRLVSINSVGDGFTGDGDGMSRAVSMTNIVQDAVRESLVYDNYIVDVIGEEGDALQVLASPQDGTSARYSAKVSFTNNYINYFTRRGIKVQAHDVRIDNNKILHTASSASEIPNIQGAISLIQGSNHVVRFNEILGCNFMPQISVYHELNDAEDFADNIDISYNKIMVTDADSPCISVISQGKNHRVTGNLIHCSRERAISCGSNTGLVIEGNTITSDYSSVTAGEEFVNITAGNSNVIVSGNLFLEGSRRCAIKVESDGMIVKDNHSVVDMIMFRDDTTGGASGTMFEGNSSKGLLFAGDGVNSDSYMGGNMTSAANRAASPIFSNTVAALGSLFVTEGQIIFQTSPVAGGTIGWVAIDRGTADTVTWKPFGQINA